MKRKETRRTHAHRASGQLLTQLTKQHLMRGTEPNTAALEVTALWTKQTVRVEEIKKKLSVRLEL